MKRRNKVDGIINISQRGINHGVIYVCQVNPPRVNPRRLQCDHEKSSHIHPTSDAKWTFNTEELTGAITGKNKKNLHGASATQRMNIYLCGGRIFSVPSNNENNPNPDPIAHAQWSSATELDRKYASTADISAAEDLAICIFNS